MNRKDGIFWTAVGLLLAGPAAHPTLIPVVGVPSHLLWWVHVLPVAMVTYREGRGGAGALVALSAALVVLGERSFGAGYDQPADWATTGSLTVALTFTNILVAGFALYARRNVRQYEVLFDAAASGIIRTDKNFRVEAANPTALRLLALEWEEIRHRRMNEVPGLEKLPPPIRLEQTGWEGAVHVESDGRTSEVHLFAAAVSHDDPSGYQVLLMDRTAEVAQEREIERQGRLATLGEALAGVAHELKNPLSVITAWSSMAADSDMDEEEMREGFELVGEQASRMQELVQELLGYARPRDSAESVRVGQLVERLVRLERMVQKGRETRLEVDLRWTGEVEISVPKLEQILVNLLSNAADAAPDTNGRVELILWKEEGDVVIQVSDNGPGVDPEMRERIFDPFVTTKPEGKGTGLGLPISRRLARAMDGSLTVDEALGGGALFTLRFPVTGPTADRGGREAEELPQTGS